MYDFKLFHIRRKTANIPLITGDETVTIYSMVSDFAALTTTTGPVQKFLIEDVLRDAGIPFSIQENITPNTILGATNPVNFFAYRVPADRLQEAKDQLCANGVLCEVSGRLLKRSIQEIVFPLLDQDRQDRDLGRLVYVVGINNKETVRALFDVTTEYDGGIELLEDLFFEIAQQGAAHLLSLARVLSENSTEDFESRFRSEATASVPQNRIALLEVLPEFSIGPWQSQVLQESLLNADGEVREAAGEALFTLGIDDYGYEPQAPVAEREEAVDRIFRSLAY